MGAGERGGDRAGGGVGGERDVAMGAARRGRQAGMGEGGRGWRWGGGGTLRAGR